MTSRKKIQESLGLQICSMYFVHKDTQQLDSEFRQNTNSWISAAWKSKLLKFVRSLPPRPSSLLTLLGLIFPWCSNPEIAVATWTSKLWIVLPAKSLGWKPESIFGYQFSLGKLIQYTEFSFECEGNLWTGKPRWNQPTWGPEEKETSMVKHLELIHVALILGLAHYDWRKPSFSAETLSFWARCQSWRAVFSFVTIVSSNAALCLSP